MFNQKYVDDYYKIIKEDEKSYKEDFEKMLKKRKEYGATYKGEEVPTLYQGFFYDQETEDIYKRIVDKFMSIVEKVTKKYCQDPDYRKLFDFDELTEKLILKDPGYKIDIPIARIDIMYDGREDFKFCEVNTDGSSAMLEDRAIAEIYKQTKAYKEFSKNYKLENINLLTSLVDSILDLYKGVEDKKPNLAIVDIIEFDNIEFKTIKKLFEKRGIKTKIVDVRDLTKKEDGLYYEDFKIDLVYRRLVTSDLIENKDLCKDFIASYLAGDFISIGSFRTTIFYTKDIFRILRLEQTKEILTKEENDFIKNHIPYTETFNYKKDLEHCLENKDSYIFKPKQAYASWGVFAGKDLSREELKNKLLEIKDKDYIYQQYYKVDPMQFLEFEEDKAKLKDFSFVTGLFTYNKKMIAPYMRIGNQSLISSAREYYTINSMKISKKLDK